MPALPMVAALGASNGWAAGIVLAQAPARALGAFEFTRIQVIACAAITSLLCAVLGYWSSVTWDHWPAFLASVCFGIILGNLAMAECLRRGGPRRTELLLSFKGPVVALIAYVWLGESISGWDVVGVLIVIGGIVLATQGGAGSHTESDRMTGSLAIVLLLGFGATLCQSVGFLVMKPAMQAGTEPLAASAIRLLGAALFLSILALWPAPAFCPKGVLTPRLLAQTILPGVIGYVVSSSLLLYAFAHGEAGIAAVLGSLAPIIVLPILWLKERKAPRPQAVLGAVAAVVGTAVIALL